MKRKLLITYIYISLWLFCTITPSAWAASSKLSALGELAVAPAATDEIYINDGGVSKKIEVQNLLSPENIPLLEGKVLVGDATNFAAPSTEIPNPVITVLPASDDTWSGTGSYEALSAGVQAQWAPVYLNAANKWVEADADASAPDARAWGIATAAGAVDTTLVVLYDGCLRNDGLYHANWTDNSLLFLSETPCAADPCADTACSDGDCLGLTDTPTTTSTEVVQPIGTYLDDDSSAAYLCVSVDHIHGWAVVP